MCVCAHSSNWSANCVECSKPSNDFFIDFFCNTHVCAHRSNWPANPQLISSATHMCVCAHSSNWSAKVLECKNAQNLHEFFLHHTCVCVLTAAIAVTLIWLFQKHTCVCPQQQLVGQPLTLGCNPHLTYSATHTCVLQNTVVGLPKLLNVLSPQMTSSLTYSATHMCVLTAAIGRPTLSWLLLQHTCVCWQQQLVCKSFSNAQSLQEIFLHPTCVCVLTAVSGVAYP